MSAAAPSNPMGPSVSCGDRFIQPLRQGREVSPVDVEGPSIPGNVPRRNNPSFELHGIAAINRYRPARRVVAFGLFVEKQKGCTIRETSKGS